MSGLPPGDPQLVSMIVSHLKTQGLFDQFRRDCLADVDTKPAYLNLKQRVDNFVSNHLSNHTWSPHLNKNQLRNNIRQLVLQSGMLEQGVDRIVAQVVDPKVNHIFRPQVERVVQEFLSPGSYTEEPPVPPPLPPPPLPEETSPDNSLPEQASSSAAAPSRDAMSILDTISTLNQEASVRSSAAAETGHKMSDDDSVEDMVLVEEGDDDGPSDRKPPDDEDDSKPPAETPDLDLKTEDSQDQIEIGKDGVLKEVKVEEKEMQVDQEKPANKSGGKPCEEKKEDDPQKSTNQAKQKARERIKEEYSLEDSDLEALSNISVSSVHTSDLSSFEEESDYEEQPSESSEEGELLSDDPSESARKKATSGDTGDEDKEQKRRRKAYVHKPFLYSRYYSDSDDEVTVEERRKSAAKDKEERLLKRQQNRERMEEKRKQKAAQTEEQDHKKLKDRDDAGLQGPQAKEARKERKVLEKKMALSRRRKLDWRKEGESSSKKKYDSADGTKKSEAKPATSKSPQPKLIRNLADSASSDERLKKTSGSVSEDSCETKKQSDKPRTHSFILELEQGSQEALKHRSVGKFDRVSRKDVHLKERKEKERSVSDERAKHKQKQEKRSEHQMDGAQQRDVSMGKVTLEEKGEKKLKVRTEKKVSGVLKEGKVSETSVEEGGSKESKKSKLPPTESIKAEKNKIKEKTKEKEKIKPEKFDFKQQLHSTGLSEDRCDMEVGSDNGKKREKSSKSVLKRSKSHSEDRLKSKPERDAEKEKPKADSDKVTKFSTESDKEPRKVKTAEKVKVPEKLKTKTAKDDIRTLSRTDKVQSLEPRGSGSACVSKAEAVKGKRKDERKVCVESSHDKSENKSVKKKTEKKEKPSEKKDETREDKKAPKQSEKPCRSVGSPHGLNTDEPPKITPLQQETTSDATLVSTSEDTGDAPEAAKEEAEPQRYEIPVVPAEADALLALMDVCTSAEARLPESVTQEVAPVLALQDADMTMKEAALTLLSMDPDSTVSCDLISPDAKEEESMESPMDTAGPEELIAAEAESTATEEFPTASHHHHTEDQHIDDGSTEAAGETESSEKEMDTGTPSLQDDGSQTASTKGAETAHIPDEKVLTSTEKEAVADVGVCEVNVPEAMAADSTVTFESQPPALVSEVSSGHEPTEQLPVMTPALKEDENAEEENNAPMDRNTCEAESPAIEEEAVSPENLNPEPINNSIPEKTEEVGEAASSQVVPIDNSPSSDSQQEEKSSDLSDKEEKMEEGERSIENAPSQEESGDKTENKTTEEAAPTEDPDMEKSLLCRRRSSRASEEAEEDEQTKEAEETTSRRGRSRSGAKAKEATSEVQLVEDDKTEENIGESASVKEATNKEGIKEESEPKTSVSLPSLLPEDGEAAGNADLKETSDQRKPSLKRKRSEVSAEDQQEENDKCNQELLEDQPENEAGSLPSVSQSEAPEEETAERKADDAEEQETPSKKPARRGRPPKAAAAESQDKKEQKGEEKESDGNEEEEMDEEEDGKEKAATRATTRAASRLEAERNKPSKPSTRASRQRGKDESAAATRGTRGQAAAAAAKGRKREASPPPVGRTRGGQKPEEPPSKRAKR